MLWLALAACTPEKVGVVEGTVLVGPGVAGGALADGTVTILGDDAMYFDEATTDRDGRFEATAPLGGNIYATIEGEGMEPTVFSGTMGLGELVIEPGVLFGWPTAERVDLDARLEGCSAPGPVVTGEVRLRGATNPETGISPLLQTAFAYLEGPDGTRYDACYFDDAGEAWLEGAPHAGLHGQYAIYGMQPGFYNLVFGYYVTEDFPFEHELRVFVGEGAVAPQFPAWAELYTPGS